MKRKLLTIAFIALSIPACKKTPHAGDNTATLEWQLSAEDSHGCPTTKTDSVTFHNAIFNVDAQGNVSFRMAEWNGKQAPIPCDVKNGDKIACVRLYNMGEYSVMAALENSHYMVQYMAANKNGSNVCTFVAQGNL